MTREPSTLTLPGFVNAHSHAFQRALRGRVEGDDFWGWRDAMLAEAATLTPARVRTLYEQTYREMLAAGYTAVGEFHYAGRGEATAAIEAARAAGIELVLLATAYGRGGLERFRQASIEAYLDWVRELRQSGVRVGLAAHSVRACTAEWLEAVGTAAASEGLVLHVHASEQPREIEECLAEHGRRPIELLADLGCLGPHTTVVHATHASEHELDLVADAGACICLCPTTEANLGDGFAPVELMVERGIRLCVGSDSNVRIDPLEELRELDGIGRRRVLRRNLIAPDRLLEIGAHGGAHALGLDAWPEIAVDLDHRSLAGVAPDATRAALVSGCGADVITAATAP
jgi:formimidoylglutamate deiminase